MGKLSDLFAQVRRTRSGKGIGFVGKSAPTLKARAAALLVELRGTDEGNAEAAVKAGADGLIFTWDGQGNGNTAALHKAVEAAQSAGEHVLCGLHLIGGWQKWEREDFEQLKELGLSFIVLPLTAPARLLGMHVKDLESVVSVPMREGELYPVFLRNLSAFERIAAIHLDFHLGNETNTLSIEDILSYRAVREAVHAPALIHLTSTPDEDDAYALLTLGVQAMVLAESKDTATTEQQIAALRDVLEKVHQDEKDTSTLGLH
ncbi:MAG: hypothetical protein ACRDHW_14165, partial [Ktedonobacteraceae bacterium]